MSSYTTEKLRERLSKTGSVIISTWELNNIRKNGYESTVASLLDTALHDYQRKTKNNYENYFYVLEWNFKSFSSYSEYYQFSRAISMWIKDKKVTSLFITTDGKNLECVVGLKSGKSKLYHLWPRH